MDNKNILFLFKGRQYEVVLSPDACGFVVYDIYDVTDSRVGDYLCSFDIQDDGQKTVSIITKLAKERLVGVLLDGG